MSPDNIALIVWNMRERYRLQGLLILTRYEVLSEKLPAIPGEAVYKETK